MFSSPSKGITVLQWYNWILHLCRQTTGDYDDVEYIAYLPDDLIVNILSRLPRQTVVQCRKVCKKWWMLTSSSHFIQLHQTTFKPLTLLHMNHNYSLKLFIIDEKRKKECDLGVLIKKSLRVRYVSSCNGLVLLRSNSVDHFGCRLEYHVLNPLSAKGTITTIGATNSVGFPCGFFFHPWAKEYRILFWRKVETGYECHIYLFGAKMWRRTANPYFNCQTPSYFRDAVIANGCLHWYISKRIMVFGMISEEFSVRPPPFDERYKEGYHKQDLLVKEDHLCFFNVGFQEKVMDIWILEDYANWYWIKKYVVDLDWDVIKYPMEGDRIGWKVALCYLNVISIHKDELTLWWIRRGLFSYHLGDNTIKKIHVKVEIDSYDIDPYCLRWGYKAYKL